MILGRTREILYAVSCKYASTDPISYVIIKLLFINGKYNALLNSKKRNNDI